MRLSVEKSDPGYDPRCFDANLHIYLDGVQLNNCITADEEKGECLVLDFENTHSSMSEIARKTLHGSVEIVFS